MALLERENAAIEKLRSVTEGFRNKWGCREEEVLSHITHDLRAPLCAIMGYLDLVGRQVGKSAAPKTTEYLSLAREAGKRMNQMVNDMLDMFRLENDPTLLQLKPIPIGTLLENLLKTFAGLSDLKNIALTIRFEGDGPRSVSSDPRYLSRALDNLVANAFKFTPVGGSIEIIAHCQQARTTFEVIDTGRGIPAVDRKRIFKKFHHVRSSDQHKGYGMGLAVVKAIAEAHGGQVRLESEIGKGSRFILWIPNAPLTPARLQAPQKNFRPFEVSYLFPG